MDDAGRGSVEQERGREAGREDRRKKKKEKKEEKKEGEGEERLTLYIVDIDSHSKVESIRSRSIEPYLVWVPYLLSVFFILLFELEFSSLVDPYTQQSRTRSNYPTIQL